VQTQGSVYRGAGARMLVTEDGDTAGSISAGCLERDVCDHAREAIERGEPRLVTYDTTSAGDIVWGLGLGCNGVVRVLVEPLEGENEGGGGCLAFLARLATERTAGAAATVYRAEPLAGVSIGERWCLEADDLLRDASSSIPIEIREAMRTAIRDERSSTASLGSMDGLAEVFVEYVPPVPSLLVFGAGPDAVPVVHLARTLGWRVTVVDTRAREESTARFAEADQVVLCRAESVTAQGRADGHTAALVMSHDYLHDLAVLRAVLPSAARYVGVLGPRARTERMMRELREEGIVFSEDHLARLHAPVGLDIGAETPEEIALSILSEIRAVCAGRSGAPLRDRSAPIHDRGAVAEANPPALAEPALAG
jgi:xanthine dehydrogenase accessory factor